VVTLPGEVLWTARYDYQPHSRLEPHLHNFFRLTVTEAGMDVSGWMLKRFPLCQAGSL
jgi:hypothetical protein